MIQYHIMKNIKVGQKVRIGKSAKCILALENFYLEREVTKPVLGRVAKVIKITEFREEPAVHLKFRTSKPIESGDIRSEFTFFPVSVLRRA